MSTLKFMSFNIRTETAVDGINCFTERFPRVAEVIEKEAPDVIGFQEVKDAMRARIRREIRGYTFIGCGRDRDYHGESMLIGFRTEDIELISLENVWLSSTPQIPGTTYGGDQSHCPRMYTTALLKHKDVEHPFRFINTHLDHMGANARYLGAMQLVQAISAYPEKFVLTGDFNAFPDSPEIGLITAALSERGTVECTKDIGGTFHNFGKYPREKWEKIDYIFTDGDCRDAYMVEDIPVNGQYYSDHCAVCAKIEL